MDKPEVLIIGYGNTLRRDDGVGPLVAEAVAGMNLPWVRVISRTQLVPELAEALSQSRIVIFVDAAVNMDGPVQLRKIDPAENRPSFGHTVDPQALLALSNQLFQTLPDAWTLSIPIEDLSFGDGLSPFAEMGFQSARKLIVDFLLIEPARVIPSIARGKESEPN